MKKILPRATFMQRMRASKIVHNLRNQYPRWQVAEMLGICDPYISGIEHRLRRDVEDDHEKGWYAPSWTIFKVLEYKCSKN